MASSPCDCWPHLSQTHSSSSTEHVWNDIKLASLSKDFNNNNNNNNHSVSVSSFLNQPPSTFLTLTSTSSSSSVFHKRHTRVIKNRESAVRSRARKQAYRSGLEVEIARLTEENSRLKRQLKELQRCFCSSPTPRMAAPCRTSSSPF